jgi:hypothetical protein
LQTEATYFRGGGQTESNADRGILGAAVKLPADWKMRKPKRRESGAHPMYCIYFPERHLYSPQQFMNPSKHLRCRNAIPSSLKPHSVIIRLHFQLTHHFQSFDNRRFHLHKCRTNAVYSLSILITLLHLCGVRLCEFDTMSAIDVLPVVHVFRAVSPATVSERQY